MFYVDELPDIYCDECGHYDCPTKASLDSEAEHKEPSKPCGDYRCCIN